MNGLGRLVYRSILVLITLAVTVYLFVYGREYYETPLEERFYHYSEGLEKMQYHSTEFDRTFERIVLVSALHPLESDVDHVHSSMEQPIVAHPDSRSIASIVRDAGQLKGKRILVSGRIIKVNPDIMDRNWVHLVDGSMDSYDFVLTTDELFPVGHVITFEGILNLDRDLGAGYHFDLLLENAHSIQ